MDKYKKLWLMAGMIIMIATITNMAGCSDNQELIMQGGEKAKAAFSFDAEHFSYRGAKLTDMQKQNMGNSMVEMVELVVSAVNGSREQVDLSAYAQNNQMTRGALSAAAYIDPLVEIAVFKEDRDIPGVFYIDYGCSAEEHQTVVADFQQKIESIVKECAGSAQTDIEYSMAVFEYLVNHCQYDYENLSKSREAGITSAESALRYNQMSLYRVLMDGSGVCQQFTRAFSILLQQADIPVLEVAGISNVPFASNNVIYNSKTEGELFGINHMWNLMQLSGKWYGADVTFAVNAKEQETDVSEAMIYRYFGMSEATMQRNFPSDVSNTTLYQEMEIPYCKEELILPQKEEIAGGINVEDTELGNGKLEKTDVRYEADCPITTEKDVVMTIYFPDNNVAYQLTIMLPEEYTKEKAYPVCYLLGDGADKELADISEAAVYIKVTNIAKEEDRETISPEEHDFSKEPSLFLNMFIGGIMEAVEKEYSVDAANRTLCGRNLGANMVLYILFQSDGPAHNVFTNYVCINPNLYYTAGGKSLRAWEEEYFRRCQELSASLAIYETGTVDSGQSARTDLLTDIIKKRQYRNLSICQ